MARVKCTNHLQRFFPDLTEVELEGTTVATVIDELNRRFPGIADYIVDEQGALRKHVNIFIGEEPVRDRLRLQDDIGPNTQVLILQALSGG